MSFDDVFFSLNHGTKTEKWRLTTAKICAIILAFCILVLDLLVIVFFFTDNIFSLQEFILMMIVINGIFGLGVFTCFLLLYRNKKMLKVFNQCKDDFVKIKAKIIPTPYKKRNKKLNNQSITVCFSYNGQLYELQDNYGNFFIGYGSGYIYNTLFGYDYKHNTLCGKNKHILFSPTHNEVFILKD